MKFIPKAGEKISKQEETSRKDITRRELLEQLSKTILVSTLSPPDLLKLIKLINTKEAGKKRRKLIDRIVICKTDLLAGENIAGLYSLYTGIDEGIVEKKILKINFSKQLRKMWSIKLQKAYKNPEIKSTMINILLDYQLGDLQRMNLKEFLIATQRLLEKVRKNIDWQKVETDMDLNNLELDFLKFLIENISTEDILAYSLTELMPYRDGNLNIKVFDFLLQYAGKKYIESIPAMYDPEVSFGPFQFTKYAIYYEENKDGQPKKGGVNIISEALPKKLQVPKSVSELRGDYHYIAAILFQIYNLSNLLRKFRDGIRIKVKFKSGKKKVFYFSEETAFQFLRKMYWQEGKTVHKSFLMFTACAHNLPSLAYKVAFRWINGVMIAQKFKRKKTTIVYRLY